MKSPKYIPSEDVYAHIVEEAGEAGLDPDFVYALAWAESSLNAHANSSVARGLMQMTKIAWEEVSDKSYRGAWNWKTNIEVGIDYLAFSQQFLEQKNQFSYPLLAACFRYGPYYVQKRNFQISNLKRPENEIYKRLFAGNVAPVLPPSED